MKNKEDVNYKIDYNILKNYVETINSIQIPMRRIIDLLGQKDLKNINAMINAINELSNKYPNEHSKIYMSVIRQMINANNGMIFSRMLEPINISRQYLLIMKNNNDIEMISRGIYVLKSVLEDSYFSFQQRYKKAIFSHMNALYFYGMTEEFPYNYTITVPQIYHVNELSEKCNVFYVADDIYEMGLVEVETPNGNKVRTYDKERCICDIIRSSRRMDSEQVKKSIRQYIKCHDKNLIKLSEYSKKMGIHDKVMDTICMLYYD